ncbi:hypothetical protein VTO42DRAFT_8273 [Malbranchea cinnamomea]
MNVEPLCFGEPWRFNLSTPQTKAPPISWGNPVRLTTTNLVINDRSILLDIELSGRMPLIDNNALLMDSNWAIIEAGSDPSVWFGISCLPQEAQS